MDNLKCLNMGSRRQMEEYQSSDEEELENTVQELEKREKIVWTEWQTFETKQGALDFLRNNGFSHAFLNKADLKTGRKVIKSFYRNLFTLQQFYKNFKCVHSLGVAIRLKQLEVPRDIKLKAKKKLEAAVPLPAKNRGPGRPKNATPALTR